MVDTNGIGYTVNLTVSGYSATDTVFTGSWAATGPTLPEGVSSGTLRANSFQGQNTGLIFLLHGPTGVVASLGCRLMPSQVGATSTLVSGSFLYDPTSDQQNFLTGLLSVTNLGN
jgi:hypothetical protein